MKATEFKERMIWLATEVKTVYAVGGQGEPATDANKAYFLEHYPKNKNFADDFRKATADTFFDDCIGAPRSIVNGFEADPSKPYGGAEHGKPWPDGGGEIKNILLDYCTKVSTDMTDIKDGEFLTYADYSHCGIYVGKINGKRMVAESTYNKTFNGRSGVQLINMDRAERKTKWKYHGQLPWIDYTDVTPSPAPVDTRALKNMVTQKIKAKKGDAGLYIQEIQKVLIARGYPCGKTGADGDFGTNTEKAVKAFQTDNKLTADGIVGYDTMTKLIGG